LSFFVDPSWKELLELNRLSSFDQVWACQAAWIETPNDDRGGWSGVGRVALATPEGGEVGVYLKRQQNHARRTWRHLYRGELTFAREFQIIRHLQRHGVMTPTPVLFAERRVHGNQQAVLMTAELAGYRSLEDISTQISALPLSRQRILLRAVARTVRAMHVAGIQPRSLYAKHLFVKPRGEDYEVVLIDFEKSRRSFLPLLPVFFDLVTLNYRTGYWSRSSRLYFFKQYYAAEKLDYWQKLLWRLIARRSQKKRKRVGN